MPVHVRLEGDGQGEEYADSMLSTEPNQREKPWLCLMLLLIPFSMYHTRFHTETLPPELKI